MRYQTCILLLTILSSCLLAKPAPLVNTYEVPPSASSNSSGWDKVIETMFDWFGQSIPGFSQQEAGVITINIHANGLTPQKTDKFLIFMMLFDPGSNRTYAGQLVKPSPRELYFSFYIPIPEWQPSLQYGHAFFQWPQALQGLHFEDIRARAQQVATSKSPDNVLLWCSISRFRRQKDADLLFLFRDDQSKVPEGWAVAVNMRTSEVRYFPHLWGFPEELLLPWGDTTAATANTTTATAPEGLASPGLPAYRG